jgi:hypothetical protein
MKVDRVLAIPIPINWLRDTSVGSRTGLVEATGVIEYRLFDRFGAGR